MWAGVGPSKSADWKSRQPPAHQHAPGGSAASTSGAATVSAMPAAATPAIDTMSPVMARSISTAVFVLEWRARLRGRERTLAGRHGEAHAVVPTRASRRPPAERSAPVAVPRRFMRRVTLNPWSSPPGAGRIEWETKRGLVRPCQVTYHACNPSTHPTQPADPPCPLSPRSPSFHSTFKRSPRATEPEATRPVTIFPRNGCRSLITTSRLNGSARVIQGWVMQGAA